MKSIWLKIGFGLAVVLTLFFLLRLVVFAVFWLDPHKERHPIEPWMTPRYISKTYDIPRDDLAAALGLEPGANPKAPLGVLARDLDIPVQDLVDAVQQVLDLFDQPPPPPPKVETKP
jgi:hypothetical protein